MCRHEAEIAPAMLTRGPRIERAQCDFTLAGRMQQRRIDTEYVFLGRCHTWKPGPWVAKAAGTAKPSSSQLTDLFWNETASGAAIHVLREVLQAQEDERLRLIVSNFAVPAARVRSS